MASFFKRAALVGVLALCAPVFASPVGADAAKTVKVKKAKASAADIALSDRLRTLKLVNYYPANAAWQAMWERWDASSFETDMGRLKGLGGNAVRLIVFPGTFGFPTPRADRLAQLQQAVQIAESQGLSVQLSLFDYWNGYSDIAGSKTWASAILKPFAGDQGIVFVELRNELNFDDPGAAAWARAMVPYAREVSQRPITISMKGTGGADALTKLQDELAPVKLDLLSFHHYIDPTRVTASYSVFQRAQKIAGTTPLFIGETGVPSTGGTASSEDGEFDQSLFYRTVSYAARQLGLGSPAPWMLNDLTPDAIPSQVGKLSASELNMGLLRTDGRSKPAASTMQRVFAGAQIDTSVNNGFEIAAKNAPNQPAGWRRWWADQGTFARDTTVARTGLASARISNATGDSSGTPAYYTSAPAPNIVPGGRYTLEAWSKAANATGRTRLAIAWFTSSGSYISQQESSDYPKGTTAWTQRSVTSVAPSNAAYAQLHLKSSSNTGTVWFDDMSLTRTG